MPVGATDEAAAGYGGTWLDAILRQVNAGGGG